jgi:capsular polysaccharide biosynthesis protein
LFEHELTRQIPETKLLTLDNVKVSQAGILFRGFRVLPESFVLPLRETWTPPKARLKFLIKHSLLTRSKSVIQEAFWFTDTWSRAYFHWMTDALPRLFISRDRISDATVLVPGTYQTEEYVLSSLKPFSIRHAKFVDQDCLCKRLRLPTHTAPTGNYNEEVIRGLRSFYADFYRRAANGQPARRVYISRSQARQRRIVNESEVEAILGTYGFTTYHFEQEPFEQQVKIALEAECLISNHGAGLTNMLFMESGRSVLELREKGDAHNNCYFSLASALNLKYFYQLCDPTNENHDAHTADLIVNGQLLRHNIEQMLAD